MNTFIQAIGFGLVTASLVAIGAMGFTLQFGLTNILNLAYGVVMTVGAFAAYEVDSVSGMNPWVGVVAGSITGAVATFLIGKGFFPFFVRRGIGLLQVVMLTLGLTLVVQFTIEAIDRGSLYQFSNFPTGRTVHVGAIVLTGTEIIFMVLALILYLAIAGLLHLTRLGKALRAMSVEPSLAKSCGIPTSKIVSVTWIVSGFLAGLAGVAYVVNTNTVDSYSGSDFLAPVLAAAILGQSGSPGGAVIASVLVGCATEIVSAYGGSAYATVAGFGVLLVVLLARPGNVMSELTKKVEFTV